MCSGFKLETVFKSTYLELVQDVTGLIQNLNDNYSK